VADLLSDPERRKMLGEKCRERVVERFSEDGVIDRLRAFYSELESHREPAQSGSGRR
jgi:glycosyltransferase involved in cell wall biosynthesis